MGKLLDLTKKNADDNVGQGFSLCDQRVWSNDSLNGAIISIWYDSLIEIWFVHFFR